jgi:hypothetical protein
MKPFVLVFVLALFFALTGCEGVIVTEGDSTHVVETITAAVYTPIPMNTPDPFARTIIDLINFQLLTPEDPLSNTLDASYRVVDVSFSSVIGNTPALFIINIECECARNGDCCNKEHIFVVITRAMKAITTREMSMGIPPSIPATVPMTVTELRVVCHDHQVPLGTMYVSWPIMREYLLGTINGDQLGWSVQKQATEMP